MRKAPLGVLRTLAAGVTVYVAMAACSAAGGLGDSSAPEASDPQKEASDPVLNPVPPARADSTKSGSRLKARFLQGSDGARHFVGWFDSERGEDCMFTAASDGTTRCMPASDAIMGIFVGSTYYADSACTQQVAFSFAEPSAGCPAVVAPKYGKGPLKKSCGRDTSQLLRVGASFTGQLYRKRSADAACSPADSDPGFIAYSTTVVPDSAFVEGTLQTEP